MVNRKSLMEALATIAPVISSRGNNEITQCALLRCNETTGSAELLATCGESSILCELQNATLKDSGAVLLPFAKVSALLKDCVADEVNIEESGSGILIRCGRDRFTVPTPPPLEFPSIGDMSLEGGFEIDASLVLRGIKRVKFATANGASNAALDGVEFSVENGTASLVAIEGVQMAASEFACDTKATAKTIIPPNLFTAFERLLEGGEKAVFVFSEKGFVGKCGSATLRGCSLIGKMPQWKPLLDKFPVAATIKTTAGEFSRCVRQAMHFTTELSNGVWLCLSGSDLSVFSDGSGECSIAIPVEAETTSIDGSAAIGLGGKRLSGYLKTLDAAQCVTISVAGKSQPTIFKTGDGCLYLLQSLNLDPPQFNGARTSEAVSV